MRVDIKVIPNAKSISFKTINDKYTLRIIAPPVDGKCNEAIILFFSKKLGIKKRDVNIINGEFSRSKTLDINIDNDAWNLFLSENY